MVVRKSHLRRRAERGAGRPIRDEAGAARGSPALLGKLARLVLTGSTAGGEPYPGRELEDLTLPNLLTPLTTPGPDIAPISNLLELAFLGRESAGELDAELDAMPVGRTCWVRSHFADDLFLSELVAGCLRVEIQGRRFPAHQRFIERVLANPPAELRSICYRQAILRELEEVASLREAAEELLGRLYGLLTLLRASRDDARLEPVRFRLDVLRAFRGVVGLMATGFAAAASGLKRLHQTGEEIRASASFGRMEALLDHDASMATLNLEAVVGADGRLRHLEVRGLRERRKNLFFRRPLRRWWDRLRIFYHRYSLDAEELVDRLVMGVYQDIAPAMARVVQLICHLEVYAASRAFANEARSRGLEVCLPELEVDATPHFEGLFNPLLLAITERPVPSDIRMDSATPVILVTGPNSGGKTRLLQAVGIAQVLAQAGLYAPCSRASVPVVPGLFASIVEFDRADQAEGRLGTELVRLRTLFETVPPGSLVLLDELCSGTNPSEAIEIVDMVLRLLRQLEPVAFVTTHFLDFAQRLAAERSADGCRFLHVDVDPELGATYRFIPGVATTSLAVGTARRLGVTFEELERKLEQRITDSEVDGMTSDSTDLET
jgi:DNA mismatch repair protein MutS2